MRALRVVLVVMGVVLCSCTAVRGGSNDSASTWADTESLRNYHSLYARILKMVKNAEHGGGELAQTTGEKENKHHNHHHHHQTKSGDQILDIFPRDLRKKEKFLKNLTGPLYFSPKCRKYVYRLYHNTRDCTIPA
ncbi:protein FAM, partial [Clarias magur]